LMHITTAWMLLFQGCRASLMVPSQNEQEQKILVTKLK